MTDLLQHIKENWKFLQTKKIFLACSGGVDSMTLLHLFHSINLDFEVMHVNYHLRGEDSNLDQELVEKTCKKLKIPFHLKSIELQNILDSEGGNLQEVARNVRYDFFEEKRILSDQNYIALGQHLDDQIETFFMHLGRKSGIMGLACMADENDRFIRPLLPFSKESIISFAEKNNISWREDYSNKTNKYKRNILRNIILPELYKEQPELKESVITLIKVFQETQKELENKIKPIFESILKTSELHFEIFDSLIQEEKNELLRELNQKSGLLIDLEKIRFSQKGKKINLEQNLKNPFNAVYNENNKFLFRIISDNYNLPVIKTETVKNLPLQFSKNEIFIDLSKTKGQLKIRKWQIGDRIKPIGLNGSKLISDIIKDAKTPTADKENIYVLTDDENILWCIGYRVSSLVVADENTKNITKISIQE